MHLLIATGENIRTILFNDGKIFEYSFIFSHIGITISKNKIKLDAEPRAELMLL
jgi:hypothetical protein